MEWEFTLDGKTFENEIRIYLSVACLVVLVLILWFPKIKIKAP